MILLIILFTSFLLSTSIYENAEDKKISRWELLKPNTFSSINNINDVDKKSRIIEFQGEGTKATYALKIKEKKMENKYWLSWQMKFSEDFVIIIGLNTNRGVHYLIYTPGVFKGHMHYGLGYTSNSEEWQTFSRNLQNDISYFDNRIKIISFKSFVVKGNGRIDNIMTTLNRPSFKKNIVKKLKLKIHKNVSKTITEEESNFSPRITLKGSSLVELTLGESYIEKGVTAYDKEDGELNIKCIENIDSMVAGRYIVLYTATDSRGNMAVDKRYIHVGKVEEEREEETVFSEKDESEESGMEERNHQIEVWERELKIREKELVQIEKKSNKN